MALHAYPHPHVHLHLPSSSSSSSSSSPRFTLGGVRAPTYKFNLQPLTLTLTSPPIGISLLPETHTRRRRRIPVSNVVEESQESSEPEAESVSEPKEQEPTAAQSELASELKKAMQERKEKEDDSFWSGVGQEISEIEWPSFGKVLGTTGVVLSVIFGSSVVLLTVNAVLAELSDKVFAGKGVQDYFS